MLAFSFGGSLHEPAFSWTYKAESWVGKVSHIAASCASGTAMRRLSVPLADKFVLRTLVHLDRVCGDS